MSPLPFTVILCTKFLQRNILRFNVLKFPFRELTPNRMQLIARVLVLPLIIMFA